MHYYNENDPKAAAWLRELIRCGHIPFGYVDTRSICDVRATELARYTQHHWFAGIGGWPLALKLAGWPEDRPVWTGSCPCQPFSNSGSMLGEADERHLFPALRNLIEQCKPPVCFGEQVASELGRDWFSQVRSELALLDYEVGASDLCAACVGATHIRQRLYWVAVAAGQRGCWRDPLESGDSQKLGGPSQDLRFESWPDGRGSSSTLGVADVLSPSYGIPHRVAKLHGLGNAIVPQVAASFIQAFVEAAE